MLESSLAGDLPSQQKRSVAFKSMLAAALLTTLKIVVGVLSGSLGILSEAAHSGLDLVAAAITYASVRMTDLPADSQHTFGHGKFEHLSAFIQTALLLITCGVIVVEGLRRLFFHAVHVESTPWAYAVMVISIAVDTFRSRALSQVAQRYNSQALEADALHFSTDVYSSSVVILGLVLIRVSEQQHLRWLQGADPVAALAVAGITLFLSVRLGRKTLDALLDAAPRGTPDRIATAVSGVRGVLNYDRIRVRQSGSRLFVDLGLTLESNIPFEHARYVAEAVESRVHDAFPDADVVVQAAPREPASSDTVERIRAVAHRHNFQVHDVTAYKLKGRVNVSLDLELDPGLRLEDAHEQATRLEREIRGALPEVDEVNTHIEPLLRNVESVREGPGDRLSMERKLVRIVRSTPGVLNCRDLETYQVGKDVLVSLHCVVNRDLSVARVHEIMDEIELSCRKAFPQISKISIHPEPSSPAA